MLVTPACDAATDDMTGQASSSTVIRWKFVGQNPALGNRCAGKQPALPWRRQPAVSLRSQGRERPRCVHREPAGRLPQPGPLRPYRGDVRRRRCRPGRLACTEWPRPGLAGIFKAEVRRGAARRQTGRSRNLERQLRRTVVVSGLRPGEWYTCRLLRRRERSPLRTCTGVTTNIGAFAPRRAPAGRARC